MSELEKTLELAKQAIELAIEHDKSERFIGYVVTLDRINLELLKLTNNRR